LGILKGLCWFGDTGMGQRKKTTKTTEAKEGLTMSCQMGKNVTPADVRRGRIPGGTSFGDRGRRAGIPHPAGSIVH